MQIISGEFKNRIIEMPKTIRPTSNKVREAFFEIFKGVIAGAGFLDLYCGSGAMGIEAVSRGAKSAAFVDNNPGCIRVLKKNLKAIGLDSSPIINIYHKAALSALGEFHRLSIKFDIVFMDPPYHRDIAKNTLIAISNYDILTRNACLAAEVFKKEALPEEAGRFKKIRSIRYGDTKLEFFKICAK